MMSRITAALEGVNVSATESPKTNYLQQERDIATLVQLRYDVHYLASTVHYVSDMTNF